MWEGYKKELRKACPTSGMAGTPLHTNHGYRGQKGRYLSGTSLACAQVRPILFSFQFRCIPHGAFLSRPLSAYQMVLYGSFSACPSCQYRGDISRCRERFLLISYPSSPLPPSSSCTLPGCHRCISASAQECCCNPLLTRIPS